MPETRKKLAERLAPGGLYDKYCQGIGFDVGCGTLGPIPGAMALEKNSKGYDGLHLPCPDAGADYVHSSHFLEHAADPTAYLREWFRAVKLGGHIVIMVPHMHLYEKKMSPPSRWNDDHKTFFTPGRLIALLEASLPNPNTYRIVHCRDNDDDYDYSREAKMHAHGCYEIELVIKKICQPRWELFK